MNENLLELYLNKLNIQKKKLSLEFVQEIQKKHLECFSFNSIAVLLGKEISLEIEDIVEKIVNQKRGGYCFEHNALMYEVLKALGFSVRLLVAKVLLNQNIDVPKTHRITLLSFEGKEYLVDVGFGSYCPNFPICVSPLIESEIYALVEDDENNYKLELSTKNGYITLYKFNLNNYTQADCVMGNFYSSNYKDAVFVNNLVVSLILKEQVLSLRNRTYYKIFKERHEEIKIVSTQQLGTILQNDFNIPIDEDDIEILFAKIEE